MAYASAARLDTACVPLIDIRALRDGSNPQAVADALHRASHEIGFVYLTNHGIDPAFLQQARSTTLDFFRRPLDDKLKISISAQHRGFLKIGAAKMGDDARPDRKESFVWGVEDADGHAPDDHPLRGTNRWPEDVPEHLPA